MMNNTIGQINIAPGMGNYHTRSPLSGAFSNLDCMVRLGFVLFFFFLPGVVGFSQGSADTLQSLTPEEYRQDFALLRKTFERTYPSLYRFKDKRSVDRLLDSCYASIGQQTNIRSFYALVKYVLGALKDGHLSSTPSASLRKSFDAQSYFPLSLLFFHDGVYNFCEHPLIPKGAQITSINAVPVEVIKEALYPYLESDGKINTSKNWILNSAFWFYYNLVYGEKQRFAVQYKLRDGSSETPSINAELRGNFICPSYAFSNSGDLLSLSYPRKKVAVLTIKTFSRQALKAAKKDFTAFVDSSFRSIGQQRINHLIIDLRGNEGGADVYGAYLYCYLTNKPFKYYKELVTIQKKLTTADHPNLSLQQRADIHYEGEVLILINGLTFSTAAEFCAIARSNKRAKFIGEETGGGYIGNTSGDFVSTVLPNTGISVSIPTTKYVMAVRDTKLKDRGIIPDYTVLPTLNDIQQNRDAQMDEAIKISARQ
jgi:hypothetical protein